MAGKVAKAVIERSERKARTMRRQRWKKSATRARRLPYVLINGVGVFVYNSGKALDEIYRMPQFTASIDLAKRFESQDDAKDWAKARNIEDFKPERIESCSGELTQSSLL